MLGVLLYVSSPSSRFRWEDQHFHFKLLPAMPFFKDSDNGIARCYLISLISFWKFSVLGKIHVFNQGHHGPSSNPFPYPVDPPSRDWSWRSNSSSLTPRWPNHFDPRSLNLSQHTDLPIRCLKVTNHKNCTMFSSDSQTSWCCGQVALQHGNLCASNLLFPPGVQFWFCLQR